MPGVEIKAAVKTLLDAAFGTAGDGRLKHALTDYPRPGEMDAPTDYPRAVIWATRHPAQTMAAGGRAAVTHGGPSAPLGVRAQTWELSVHIKHLTEDPLAQGPAYHQLVDDVETMLMQYPDLNGAAGSTPSGTGWGARDWRVLRSYGIAREMVPPFPVDDAQIAFNAFVTLHVEEHINA